MSTNATTPPAAVTVIGLGNMGLPMAACLLKAGFQVTGFDLSEAARAKFQAAGGRVAATASDAAKTADVVITLLPDGKIVRAVLEPLKKGFKPGAIIVDMSSSDPIGTQELGNSLIAAGFEFIDAPISGGVKRATDGTLAIMVGGDGATIDRVDALLSAMGKSIFRTGKLGSGHAMKALNRRMCAPPSASVMRWAFRFRSRTYVRISGMEPPRASATRPTTRPSSLYIEKMKS